MAVQVTVDGDDVADVQVVSTGSEPDCQRYGLFTEDEQYFDSAEDLVLAVKLLAE